MWARGKITSPLPPPKYTVLGTHTLTTGNISKRQLMFLWKQQGKTRETCGSVSVQGARGLLPINLSDLRQAAKTRLPAGMFSVCMWQTQPCGSLKLKHTDCCTSQIYCIYISWWLYSAQYFKLRTLIQAAYSVHGATYTVFFAVLVQHSESTIALIGAYSKCWINTVTCTLSIRV